MSENKTLETCANQAPYYLDRLTLIGYPPVRVGKLL